MNIQQYCIKSHINMTLISVCLLLFVDAIGAGLTYPLLPYLFMDKHGLIVHGTISHRDTLFAIAFVVFPLGAILGMPILGDLSDSIGRKKTLLLGVLGIILSYAFTITAIFIHNVQIFLLSRFILGISNGTFSVANAAIIDLHSIEEKRSDCLKYSMLASVLGFILGPGFVLFTTNSYNQVLSISTPFIIAMALAITNCFMLLLIFPSSKSNALNNKALLPTNHLIGKFIKLVKPICYIFSLRHLLRIVIGYMFFYFGFALFLQSLPMYLTRNYNYSVSQIGSFYVCMGLSLTFSAFILKKKVTKFIKIDKQLLVGLFLLSALLLGYGLISYLNMSCLSHNLDMRYIIWIISSLFYIVIPFVEINFTTIFSSYVEKQDQGKIMGGIGQLYSLSWMCAASVMGKLGHNFEYMLVVTSGLAILLSYTIIFNKLSKVRLCNYY